MTRSHPDHEYWHGNIGKPISIDAAGATTADFSVVDVLSWNIAIGRGRLTEVIEKIGAGAFDGVKRSSARPLVVLAQEAFRSDESIPAQLKSIHHGGQHPENPRHDIVDIARSLQFSLRYSPSMRNGEHRSDRGNAILSNVPIANARSFALPHVRQMRIALSLELAGLPWLTFACAHLDTRGRIAGGRRRTRIKGYGAGRAEQAHALALRLAQECGPQQSVLLGADLNSYLATREPLMRALLAEGFHRVPHTPQRTHTFHAPPLRMILDHILTRNCESLNVSVRRLDENPADSGTRVFGSDHHPLLATLRLV